MYVTQRTGRMGLVIGQSLNFINTLLKFEQIIPRLLKSHT